MPLYEYECDACGERFEVIQKFSDSHPETCKLCGNGPVRRLMSSPAIQFKGSGWYITDYAQKGKSEGSSADTTTKGGDDKSDTSQGKSEKSDTGAKSDPGSRGDAGSKKDASSKSDAGAKSDAGSKSDAASSPPASSSSTGRSRDSKE